MNKPFYFFNRIVFLFPLMRTSTCDIIYQVLELVVPGTH